MTEKENESNLIFLHKNKPFHAATMVFIINVLPVDTEIM